MALHIPVSISKFGGGTECSLIQNKLPWCIGMACFKAEVHLYAPSLLFIYLFLFFSFITLIHLIVWQVSGPGRWASWLGLITPPFPCITSTWWRRQYRRWRPWRLSCLSSGTWRVPTTSARRETACCLDPMSRWRRWCCRTPGWETEYLQVSLSCQPNTKSTFISAFLSFNWAVHSSEQFLIETVGGLKNRQSRGDTGGMVLAGFSPRGYMQIPRQGS